MYSSLQRSINARKQLRDRRGRWIEMGAEVKYLLKGLMRLGEVIGIDPRSHYVSVRDRKTGEHFRLHASQIESVSPRGHLSSHSSRVKGRLDKAPSSSNLTHRPDRSYPLPNGARPGSNIVRVSTDRSGREWTEFPASPEEKFKGELGSQIFDSIGANTRRLYSTDRGLIFESDSAHDSDIDLSRAKLSPSQRGQLAQLAVAQAFIGNKGVRSSQSNRSNSYGVMKDADGNLFTTDFGGAFEDEGNPSKLLNGLRREPGFSSVSDSDWRDAVRSVASLSDHDIDSLLPNNPAAREELRSRRDKISSWGARNVGFNNAAEWGSGPAEADAFKKIDDPNSKLPRNTTERLRSSDGRVWDVSDSSPAVSQNDVLSARLRALVGDPVSRNDLAYRDGKLVRLQEADDSLTDFVSAPSAAKDRLWHSYGVDAWLDSRGLTDFNTGFDKGGNPVRRDFSGDLLFSPDGKRKTDGSLKKLDAFEGLRNPGSDKSGLSHSYQDMSDAQAAESLKSVVDISPLDIRDAVRSVYGDSDTGKRMEEALLRRQDFARSYRESLLSKPDTTKDSLAPTPNSVEEARSSARVVRNVSSAPAGSKISVGDRTFIRSDKGWEDSNGDIFSDDDIVSLSKASKLPAHVTRKSADRRLPEQQNTSTLPSTEHLHRDGMSRIQSANQREMFDAAPKGSVFRLGDKEYSRKGRKWVDSDGNKVSSQELHDLNKDDKGSLYVPHNKAAVFAQSVADRRGEDSTVNFAIDSEKDLSLLRHAPAGSRYFSTKDGRNQFTREEDGTWLASDGSFVRSGDRRFADLLRDNKGNAQLSQPFEKSDSVVSGPQSLDGLKPGSTVFSKDGSVAVKQTDGSFRDYDGNAVQPHDVEGVHVPAESANDVSAPSKDMLDRAPVGSTVGEFTKGSDAVWRDRDGNVLKDPDFSDEDKLHLPERSRLSSKPTPSDSTLARPDSGPAEGIVNRPSPLPSSEGRTDALDAPETPEPKSPKDHVSSNAFDLGTNDGMKISDETFKALADPRTKGFELRDGRLTISNTTEARDSLLQLYEKGRINDSDGEFLANQLEGIGKDVSAPPVKRVKGDVSSRIEDRKNPVFGKLLYEAGRKDSGLIVDGQDFRVTDYGKAFDSLDRVERSFDSLSRDFREKAQRELDRVRSELTEKYNDGVVPNVDVVQSVDVPSSDVRARIGQRLRQLGGGSGFDVNDGKLLVTDPRRASASLERIALGSKDEGVKRSIQELSRDVLRSSDVDAHVDKASPVDGLSSRARRAIDSHYMSVLRKSDKPSGLFVDKDGKVFSYDDAQASYSLNRVAHSLSVKAGQQKTASDRAELKRAASEVKSAADKLAGHPDASPSKPKDITPHTEAPTPRSSTPQRVAHSLEDLGVERTEPVRLPGEDYAPTREQQDVIDAVNAWKNVSVQALAGTGKTSTIEAVARRLPEGKKGLYVAFNKSVAEEANRRMPKNVDAMTGHSLAYRWARDSEFSHVIDKMRNKRIDGAKYLDAPKDIEVDGKQVSPERAFNYAKNVVDAFQRSDRDRLSKRDIEDAGIKTDTPDKLLSLSNKIWDDYLDKDGKLPTDHDTYRKLWALSRPDLTENGKNVLFLDEAQDTPPVLSKVVRDQKKMQRVVVGDSDQAIYGFSGSKDFFKGDHGSDGELFLTNSFRFGPESARVGNAFLNARRHVRGDVSFHKDVVGGGPATRVVDRIDNPDAVLTRTNQGLLEETVRALGEGRSKIAVPSGTRSNLASMMDSVAFLKGEGARPSRLHPDLEGFKSWSDVVNAQRNGNHSLDLPVRLFNDMSDGELRHHREALNSVFEKLPAGASFNDSKRSLSPAAFDVVSSYGTLDPKKWRKVGKSWTTDDPKEYREASRVRDAIKEGSEHPDLTVSTAHKAKGLEWDRVQLGDDFKRPKDGDDFRKFLEDLPDEEYKLDYVAATRGKKELGLGGLSWVRDLPEYKDHDSHRDHDHDDDDHRVKVHEKDMYKLRKAERDASECSVRSSASRVDLCPYGGDTGYRTDERDGSIDVHDPERARKTVDDLEKRERDEDDKKRLRELRDEIDKIIDRDRKKREKDRERKRNERDVFDRIGINPVNHLPWNGPSGLGGLPGGLPFPDLFGKKKKKAAKAVSKKKPKKVKAKKQKQKKLHTKKAKQPKLKKNNVKTPKTKAPGNKLPHVNSKKSSDFKRDKKLNVKAPKRLSSKSSKLSSSKPFNTRTGLPEVRTARAYRGVLPQHGDFSTPMDNPMMSEYGVVNVLDPKPSNNLVVVDVPNIGIQRASADIVKPLKDEEKAQFNNFVENVSQHTVNNISQSDRPDLPVGTVSPEGPSAHAVSQVSSRPVVDEDGFPYTRWGAPIRQGYLVTVPDTDGTLDFYHVRGVTNDKRGLIVTPMEAPSLESMSPSILPVGAVSHSAPSYANSPVSLSEHMAADVQRMQHVSVRSNGIISGVSSDRADVQSSALSRVSSPSSSNRDDNDSGNGLESLLKEPDTSHKVRTMSPNTYIRPDDVDSLTNGSSILVGGVLLHRRDNTFAPHSAEESSVVLSVDEVKALVDQDDSARTVSAPVTGNKTVSKNLPEGSLVTFSYIPGNSSSDISGYISTAQKVAPDVWKVSSVQSPSSGENTLSVSPDVSFLSTNALSSHIAKHVEKDDLEVFAVPSRSDVNSLPVGSGVQVSNGLLGEDAVAYKLSKGEWAVSGDSGDKRVSLAGAKKLVDSSSDNGVSPTYYLHREYPVGTILSDPSLGKSTVVSGPNNEATDVDTEDPVSSVVSRVSPLTTVVSPDSSMLRDIVYDGGAGNVSEGSAIRSLPGRVSAVKTGDNQWRIDTPNGSSFAADDDMITSIVRSNTLPSSVAREASRFLTKESGETLAKGQFVHSSKGNVSGHIVGFDPVSREVLVKDSNGKVHVLPAEDVEFGGKEEFPLNGQVFGPQPNPNPLPNPNPNPQPKPKPAPNPRGEESSKTAHNMKSDKPEGEKGSSSSKGQPDSTITPDSVKSASSQEDKPSTAHNANFPAEDKGKSAKDSKDSPNTGVKPSKAVFDSDDKKFVSSPSPREIVLQDKGVASAIDRIADKQAEAYMSRVSVNPIPGAVKSKKEAKDVIAKSLGEHVLSLRAPYQERNDAGDLVNRHKSNKAVTLAQRGIGSFDDLDKLHAAVKNVPNAFKVSGKGRSGYTRGPRNRKMRFHQISYYDRVLDLDGNVFQLKGTDDSVEPVRKDSFDDAGEFLATTFKPVSEATRNLLSSDKKLSADVALRQANLPGTYGPQMISQPNRGYIEAIDSVFTVNPVSFYANMMMKAESFLYKYNEAVSAREELRNAIGSIVSDFGYLDLTAGVDSVFNSDPQYNDINLMVRVAADSNVISLGDEKNSIVLPRGTALYIDDIVPGPLVDTVWVEVVPMQWNPPEVDKSASIVREKNDR